MSGRSHHAADSGAETGDPAAGRHRRWTRAAVGASTVAAAALYLPAGASGTLALVWLAVALLGLPGQQWLPRREGRVALLAWVAWMLASLAWSPVPAGEAAKHAALTMLLLVVPLLAATLDATAARRALAGFVLGALLLVAAWAWHAVSPWPARQLLSSLVHYSGNKSISNGVLVALAASLALHLGWLAGGRWPRALWWLASAVLTAAVLAYCPARTAHGVAVLLPLAWLGLQLRSARGRWLLVLASVTLAAAGWAWIGSGSAGGGGLAARDAAGQLQASNDNRRVLYEASLQMISERPLVGHGLGAWSTLWLQRNQREDMREFNTAHSVPLQLWAEGGAIGLLLLAAAVWGWAAAARAAGARGAGAPLVLVLLAWGLTALVNAALRDAVFSVPMAVLTALALAQARPPPAGTRPPPR